MQASLTVGLPDLSLAHSQSSAFGESQALPHFPAFVPAFPSCWAGHSSMWPIHSSRSSATVPSARTQPSRPALTTQTASVAWAFSPSGSSPPVTEVTSPRRHWQGSLCKYTAPLSSSAVTSAYPRGCLPPDTEPWPNLNERHDSQGPAKVSGTAPR